MKGNRIQVQLTSVHSAVRCNEDNRIVWKHSKWIWDLPKEQRPRIWTSPELWFSKPFLWHPHWGWTVELDAMDDVARKAAEDEFTDDPRIYSGVLIRHHNPQVVYKLTGEADEHDLLKGVWPD